MAKLVELELRDCDRLTLTGINNIIYRPENNIQIILGINGSGKSSVLAMANELPADLTKDFGPNGYKKVTIEHNGSTFVGTSDASLRKKHSLVVDGTEMNDGGTHSAQLKLIHKYFGTSKAIYDILLGVNKFTKMRPTERKKWITELCSVDYTYSLSVWNKMKQRLRDVTGGIKLNNADIARYKLDVLTEEQVSSLKDNRDALTELLEVLYSNVSNWKEDNAVETTRECKALTAKLDKLNKVTVNTAELSASVTGMEAKLSYLTTENTRLTADVAKYREAISSHRDTLLVNIADIKNKLDSILNDSGIETLTPELCVSAATHHHALLLVSEKLDTVHDVTLSKTHMSHVINIKSGLEITLTSIQGNLSRFRDRVTYLDQQCKDDNIVACPVCDHKWHLGVDLDNRSEVREKITALVTDEETIIGKLTAATHTVADVERKQELHKDIISMSTDHNVARIFKEAYGSTYLTPAPVGFSNSMSNTLFAISSVSNDVLDLSHQLEVLTKKLETATVNTEHNPDLPDEVDITEKTISRNAGAIALLVSELRVATATLQLANNKDTLVSKLQTTITKLNTLRRNGISNLKNKALKELATELKNELRTINNRLLDHGEQHVRITVAKQRVEEYTAAKDVLVDMLKDISPSEGLIAKSINSYLNIFLTDINTVISMVWKYDLTILPCSITDDTDLNYIFKVMVANCRKPIDDISKTSSGMREIIDLAFKIVFAKYMGLSAHPLFLDEFGRTFDTNHRITAYETVERVLLNKFDQVFMVSHFESMYGRFTNADVSVIGNLEGRDKNNKVMIIN